MPELTGGALWDLLKHLRTWLANLRRASRARKVESVKALREVVGAARETAVYLRHIERTGRPDHRTEAELARRWTELGFTLEDLGISALAKRCRITGKQWADPSAYGEEFLAKADVSLERMERLATEILSETTR